MWLRTDDTKPDEPEFVGIDPRAGWLWFLGSSYAARHLTNGRLTEAVARGLAERVDPQQALLTRDRHPLIEQLLQRKIWKATRGGYIIAKFLRENPSRNHVLAERKAARERWERYKGKRRKPRRARASAAGDAHGVATAQQHRSNEELRRPVPSLSRPVGETKTKSFSSPRTTARAKAQALAAGIAALAQGMALP